jgi:hypothetical protein
MKSATSGKAGGLREREPFKAVVVYHEALKVSPVPVVGVCLLFPDGFHDFQVLHRFLFTSLLSWAWHGYMDQTI